MDLCTVFSQLEMSTEAHHEKITFAEAADRFVARQNNGDGRRYFEIKVDEAAAAAKRDEEAVADEHADDVDDDEHVADEPAKVVATLKKKRRGRVRENRGRERD